MSQKNEDNFTISTLAKLANIELTEKEEDTLKNNLSKIVHYMDMLKEVDTEGVPPCQSVVKESVSGALEDRKKQPLDRTTFLDNSPSQVAGMIRVPRVIKF